MASLIASLSDVPIACIDVETTGLSFSWGHRVIEVGVVRMQGGCVVEEYEQLIDPGRWVGPEITQITGITPEMLLGRPKFDGQLAKLVQVLGGAVLVMHNADFDLPFLAGEFGLAGRPIYEAMGLPLHVLDTVRIARRRFGRGGNSLGPLSRRLGIEATGAHRALADARMTAALLGRLLAPVGGWGMTLADAILLQGGPLRVPGARVAMQPAAGAAHGNAVDGQRES